MTAALIRMDAAQARAITDRIKVGVEAVWDLIKTAYTERAWDALGYASWDDYTTREFGTSRLRLPREERAEVVASLREAGLSIRAIASATGNSFGTIQATLTSGDQFRSPVADPTPAALIDTDECEADDGDDGLADEIDHEPEPEPEPVAPTPAPTVTGLDGKTYAPKKSTATEPRRKPLVDTARDLGLDIAKLAKRVEDFGADDRLVRNKTEVAPRLRSHLDYVIKVCRDLNQQLTEEV